MKTWQEEFDKKFEVEKMPDSKQEFSYDFDDETIKKLKKFISDLRKRDMEELIKLWRNNAPTNVPFINFEGLIKDYYNN